MILSIKPGQNYSISITYPKLLLKNPRVFLSIEEFNIPSMPYREPMVIQAARVFFLFHSKRVFNHQPDVQA